MQVIGRRCRLPRSRIPSEYKIVTRRRSRRSIKIMIHIQPESIDHDSAFYRVLNAKRRAVAVIGSHKRSKLSSGRMPGNVYLSGITAIGGNIFLRPFQRHCHIGRHAFIIGGRT